RILMAVDTRTNSLLVTAKGEDMALVAKAIREIDVPDSGSGRARFGKGPNVPQFEPHQIMNADPEVVMDVLYNVVPGAIIRADARAKSLYVYASPSDQQAVRNIIRELDRGNGESATVIRLSPRMDPAAAQTSLLAWFGGAGKPDVPGIQADAGSHSLMVRG